MMAYLEDNSAGPQDDSATAQTSEPVLQTPLALPDASIPEDLRVLWSWGHLLLFVFFAAGSTLVIPAVFVVYLLSARHMKMEEVQKYLVGNAGIAVGVQLLVFVAWMLFLYFMILAVRGAPFWRGIGWRPLPSKSKSRGGAIALYFLAGMGLAIFVGVASNRVHPKGKIPIEEFFNSRNGTLLLLGLAVLVAPLVEETVFRGFLYPVIARTFGVPVGVVVTGILFGLLHGIQLGWTWGLVGLLTLVGIVLTMVRARSGTVFASYLCHLGYNFMLFLGTAAATRGFTHFPPGP